MTPIACSTTRRAPPAGAPTRPETTSAWRSALGNTDLRRAGVALQFDDPAAALAACGRVSPADLPAVVRRARHRVRAATGHVMLRRDDEAVRALLAVEAMSPELFRADSTLAAELACARTTW